MAQVGTLESHFLVFIRIGKDHVFPFPALTLVHLGPDVIFPFFPVTAHGKGEIPAAYLSEIEDFEVVPILAQVEDNLFFRTAGCPGSLRCLCTAQCQQADGGIDRCNDGKQNRIPFIPVQEPVISAGCFGGCFFFFRNDPFCCQAGIILFGNDRESLFFKDRDFRFNL